MLNTFSLQIGDLVYSYPEQDDPDIQTIISGRREFRELASNVTEPVPPPGTLYKHQELVKRYLLIANRMLIFHRTGTGKTCSIFGSAEQFRKSMMAGVGDFIMNYMMPRRTNIKKIYVLTSGRALVEELRRQLVCVCTGGDYLTDLVLGSTTEASRKGNITKAISPYYQIMTYGSFTNYITKRQMTDEQIKAALDDTIIYVDEIQNLRPDPSLGTLEEQTRKYDTLHHIFHIIERSKVIGATATPMVDNVGEIVSVMNLLLPLDQQLDRGRNYFGATLEEMEPYFRGKISYVRELDTGARPYYPGEVLDSEYLIRGDYIPSQSIVYKTQMSERQEESYLRSAEDRVSFRVAERRTSNFVFPDGESGKESFDRYLTRDSPDEYTANADLAPWLEDINNLRELSCKFASTIEIEQQNIGNAFCFCEFKKAGGAAMLGACFKYQGFEQYTSNTSAFVGSSDTGVLRPYCSSASSTGSRRINIAAYGPTQPYRFALITSDTPDTRIASILELFNSPENFDGRYLKVVIGSAIAKTGLNLANVRRVHLIGPSWNQSNIYQAISRALRSTSHVLLIQKEAERLQQLGLDPTSARVDVAIYQHAAITQAWLDDPTNEDLKPIDITMYEAAEEKDIGIRQMERKMKQCAIDCQIHYNRNVRSTDENGSAICDYDDCAYVCVSPEPEVIDESSFAVLYSEGITDAIVEQLKLLLSSNSSLTLDRIQQILSGRYPPMYILFAVEKMVRERIPVVNRYGARTYVQEDGQTVFLQRDYPLLELPDRGLSYYTEVLHGVYHIDLPKYVSLIQGPLQEQLLLALTQIDPQSEEFETILNQLNVDSRVALLEQALLNQYSAQINVETAAIEQGLQLDEQAFNQAVTALLSPVDNEVLRQFERYIYTFREPVTAIQEAITNLANRGGKRGRKPNPESKTQIRRLKKDKQPNIPVEYDTEQITVHTLYSQTFDRVSYAVTSKFNKAEGRLRLFKPSEQIGFRDANSYELPIYNQLIQQELARRTSDFEENDIYATINRADNNFRIRDKTTENRERAAKDARSINRGKTCKDWKKPDLIELMYKLGIQAPDPQPITMNRDEMVVYLRQRKADTTHTRVIDMPDDMLEFFVHWYQSKLTKNRYMCPTLLQYFEDNNLLLIV